MVRFWHSGTTLLLSLNWLIIRGVFWLLTITSRDQWEAFQFYILYWLPAPLEFGSFMLVPLFFGQVLYPDIWKVHSPWILPVYGVVTFGLISFMVMWALLAAMEQSYLCFEHYHIFNVQYLASILAT